MPINNSINNFASVFTVTGNITTTTGDLVSQDGGVSVSNLVNDDLPVIISLTKNRAGATVQDDDNIGALVFNGFDGTSDEIGGGISMDVDGVPSTGEMPTRLVFATRALGDTLPSIRMEISSVGIVSVNSFVGSRGVVQSANNGVLSSTEGTAGQLLIGSNTVAPAWANITAGSGISVVNGSNTITISSTGGAVVDSIIGDVGSPQTGAITLSGGTSGGIFDSTTTTITQNFNFLSLPVTTLTDGQILLGGSALLQAFGDSGNSSQNTFLGIGTGSFTVGPAGIGITAVGAGSMPLITSDANDNNTCVGANSMLGLIRGFQNTTIGASALQGIESGNNNIVIGYSAGNAYTGSNSNNIAIGNNGAVENDTIRIGRSQTACFIAGISGINVGSVASVVSMSSGQLGTTTITAGANITITPAANTITIAATPAFAPFPWTVVSGTSQALAINNGYEANNAALVTLTLPATAAFGSTIKIMGKGAGGWKVAQNASQIIFLGSSTTTTGTGGSLASTNRRDCIEMVCSTTDTEWTVVDSIGNITVV